MKDGIKLIEKDGWIMADGTTLCADNGVVGKSPDWLNIAIFFISAALSYIYETRLFNSERSRCRSPKLAIAILCIIALLFVIFTFATPEINIFRDPLTDTYGI